MSVPARSRIVRRPTEQLELLRELRRVETTAPPIPTSEADEADACPEPIELERSYAITRPSHR